MERTLTATLEIWLTMLQDFVGPNGLSNQNLKGKDLLYLLKSNPFKILLFHFTNNNYVTYRNFSASQIPHMLHNSICCDNFLKRVTDFKVATTGAISDHYPIQATF